MGPNSPGSTLQTCQEGSDETEIRFSLRMNVVSSWKIEECVCYSVSTCWTPSSLISQSNQCPLSLFWLVLAACNPNTCRASGRGLQPKGLRVKEVADFKVYTKGAGSGELKVTVKGPSTWLWILSLTSNETWWTSLKCVSTAEGQEEPVKVLEMENGLYECNYYPIKTGKYTISVTWGGHSIPRRWDCQLLVFNGFSC